MKRGTYLDLAAVTTATARDVHRDLVGPPHGLRRVGSRLRASPQGRSMAARSATGERVPARDPAAASYLLQPPCEPLLLFSLACLAAALRDEKDGEGEE